MVNRDVLSCDPPVLISSADQHAVVLTKPAGSVGANGTGANMGGSALHKHCNMVPD